VVVEAVRESFEGGRRWGTRGGEVVLGGKEMVALRVSDRRETDEVWGCSPKNLGPSTCILRVRLWLSPSTSS
jgi:hypothetical protein